MRGDTGRIEHEHDYAFDGPEGMMLTQCATPGCGVFLAECISDDLLTPEKRQAILDRPVSP